MSVRRKLFWLLFVTIFLFGAILAGIWVTEWGQIGKIERERLQEQREALGRDLNFWGSSLDNFTTTFARSEAIAAAIQNDDKAAVDREFTDEVLTSYRVPVVWLYRPDKSLFTSRNRLYSGGLQEAPLPHSSFEGAFSGKNSTHFFTKTPTGVVEVRGMVVQSSSGSAAKPVGYLFAVRLWNDEELMALSAFTGNELRIVDANYSTQGLKLPNGGIAFTYPLNGRAGKPVAQVLAQIDSPVLQHARWLRTALWLWALFFSAGILTALFLGLQRWVWRPLGAIVRSVRKEQVVTFPFDKDRTELGELARLVRSFFEQRDTLMKELRDERQSDRTSREKEEHNRQSQKMEAIARLAGGFAHDMNHSLATIGTLAASLKERTSGNPEVQEACDLLSKAVADASVRTRKLLAFSGREAFAPELFDLNALVNGMERRIREIVGNDIRLRIYAEAPEGSVRADPRLLEQLIVQLVKNAKDAMPEGGDLTISTAKTLIPEPTQHDGLEIPAGTYVTMEVADTGEGMEEAVKERIFEPFFTTKSVVRNAGLGLSMVYAIARQSGGAIAVDSNPGRGTTFFVHLPLQPEPVVTAPVSPVNPMHDGLTALVVEDDASMRETVSGVLRERGIHVLPAYDADSAWVVTRKHHGAVHLIVADLSLPDATGSEVVSQIASLHPNAKVLYLQSGVSSTPSPGTLPGGEEVLVWPFALSRFRDRVTALLGRSPVLRI